MSADSVSGGDCCHKFYVTVHQAGFRRTYGPVACVSATGQMYGKYDWPYPEVARKGMTREYLTALLARRKADKLIDDYEVVDSASVDDAGGQEANEGPASVRLWSEAAGNISGGDSDGDDVRSWEDEAISAHCGAAVADSGDSRREAELFKLICWPTAYARVTFGGPSHLVRLPKLQEVELLEQVKVGGALKMDTRRHAKLWGVTSADLEAGYHWVPLTVITPKTRVMVEGQHYSPKEKIEMDPQYRCTQEQAAAALTVEEVKAAIQLPNDMELAKRLAPLLAPLIAPLLEQLLREQTPSAA